MNYINLYAKFLNKFLNPQKELKVVFDSSNGTTGLVLKKIRHSRLKTILLNDRPDGNFPAHGPNPMADKASSELQIKVKTEKADLGIIFDADGDRAFFIDDKGRMISSDIISYLLIHSIKPKKAIIDARSGWLLRRHLDKKTKILECRVGHFFIKKLMRKTGTEFAGERSGHYYFPALGGSAPHGKNTIYFDSGIIAAIQAINAASQLPFKLSNYIDLLPRYYESPELNFKTKNGHRLMDAIERIYRNKTDKISHLDGLSAEMKSITTGGEWWFNLRTSNTEPTIRLNIEADSKKLLDLKTKELEKVISHLEY